MKKHQFAKKDIPPFPMMETAVTNAMFAEFIEDTGYTTEAEKPGWSFYDQVCGKLPQIQKAV